jgi:hypothetical protein
MRLKKVWLPADVVDGLVRIGGTAEQGFEIFCTKIFTPDGPVIITTAVESEPCRTNEKKD